MRIVAGKYRGRRLATPTTQKIRPTADRVREALFSIIAARVPGARVLDLFAGTGALGLEALSRGAVQAVFVDRDAEAVHIIRANVRLLGVVDRVEVFHGEVSRVVKHLVERQSLFDILFMDPPYGKGHIESTLPILGALAHPRGLLIAEHPVKELPPAASGDWRHIDTRTYGDTAISFYSRETGDSPQPEFDPERV